MDAPHYNCVLKCPTTSDQTFKLITGTLITILTLEVTNDNFHGVHRLELYILAFLKNHCIANTGRKNINKIPLCC